jgi:formylglycine-generating enzyme required for sulfatase activity
VTNPSSVINLREPSGERLLATPLSVGGPGAAVLVPGVADSAQIQLLARSDGWYVVQGAALLVELNGEALSSGEHELRVGDVLSLGHAQLVCNRLDPAGGAQVDVWHLEGNDTVAPIKPPPTRLEQDDDNDVEILANNLADAGFAGKTRASEVAAAARRPRRLGLWLGVGLAAGVLTLSFGVLSRLQRVPLELTPRDSQVASNRWLSWHSGATLFALPGTHELTASRVGYESVSRRLEVTAKPSATQQFRLEKLPGKIVIDTGGIAATVTVDGQPAGRAPGEVLAKAGSRTFTVRAERYLDAVQKLEVEGEGREQTLQFALRTSWGQLEVVSRTAGALAAAGEAPARTTPAKFDLPSGVHRVRLTAPGAKDWQSTVIVKAGETVRLGPIELGAPDTQLRVSSNPPGANVTVGGEFRGRTPLSVALPSGANYDVVVARPGYAVWSRSVAAAPGERVGLAAQLAPVLVAVSVVGEPADAELWIDGDARGKLPQTVQLTATSHRVEVRKAGMETFVSNVDLGTGLARNLDYRLVPAGRSADWRPPAARITPKHAGALRLIEPVSFTMGSERRDQGRRPNESLRKVTLTRAYYIGVREVSNGEFRRFRGDHQSGFIGKQSLDLDNQPVTSVTFNDAAAYCNWLSKQEGLPEAYESRDGRFVLKQPVTAGYRLPTEAEWEYAARAAADGWRRYEWGATLPVPTSVINIAGTETASAYGSMLESYQDEYPTVAPVGKFAANSLGLFDMSGNVSEWVNDRYSSLVDNTAMTDPLGPDSGRANVVRGASWRTASIAGLRLAWRDASETARDDLGFRIARYAE